MIPMIQAISQLQQIIEMDEECEHIFMAMQLSEQGDFLLFSCN